jgi:hypothetical protein
MTAAELRLRVRFYLNQLASPRVDDIVHINQGLNAAQVKFIEDRVDNIKQAAFHNRKVFFEAVERVRSELYTIVITPAPIVAVANVIALPVPPSPFPFYYELALALNYSNGQTEWSTAKSWNEFQELERNSFTKPSVEYPIHVRSNAGMTAYFGQTVLTLTSGTLTYIFLPPAIDVTNNITSVLPPVTHEELCEIAAHIIAGTYDDFRKSQMMQQQVEED